MKGELWYKDNQPYKYVAQPYFLDKTHIEKLNRVCNEHYLDYRFYGDSYHFQEEQF